MIIQRQREIVTHFFMILRDNRETKTKANAVASDIKYRSSRVSSGMISTVNAVAKSKSWLSICIAMQKLVRDSFTYYSEWPQSPFHLATYIPVFS